MDLAERAAAAHRASLAQLQSRAGQGWHEEHAGFSAGVTEIPAAPFNGVSVYGDHDPALLSGVLERIAASGLPFSLQTRAAQTESVADLAQALGMERQAAMPLMVTTEPPAARTAPGLEIRELAPEAGADHAIVAAEGFAAPLELMHELTRPAMLAPPGVHVLVGYLEDIPVSTALVNVGAGAGAILNVATRAAHRGRGFGAAVTSATVRQGFAAGAELCFLLSTPMGVGIYEDLGFRTLEFWTSWMGLPEL